MTIPADRETLCRRALDLMLAGKHIKAEAAFAELCQVDPTARNLQLWGANCFFRRDYQRSHEILESLLRSTTEPIPLAWALVAQARYASRQNDLALMALHAAIKDVPRSLDRFEEGDIQQLLTLTISAQVISLVAFNLGRDRLAVNFCQRWPNLARGSAALPAGLSALNLGDRELALAIWHRFVLEEEASDEAVRSSVMAGAAMLTFLESGALPPLKVRDRMPSTLATPRRETASADTTVLSIDSDSFFSFGEATPPRT